jgi:hypothetical protein
MHPRLQAARASIDRTVDGLTVEEIARPLDGRWSISQILEHLTLAFTLSAAAFEKPLASGELRFKPPGIRSTAIRILVVDLGYFPKVEAPAGTRPTASIPPEHAIDAIREGLVKLDAALERMAQRFGEDVPVSNHPYFLGLTIRQWRKFHWRHTVHHMKQIAARRSM